MLGQSRFLESWKRQRRHGNGRAAIGDDGSLGWDCGGRRYIGWFGAIAIDLVGGYQCRGRCVAITQLAMLAWGWSQGESKTWSQSPSKFIVFGSKLAELINKSRHN